MEPQDTVLPSLGEKRVRTTFNPSANSNVDIIKQKTAELINLCESLKDPYNGQPNEKNRTLTVAQTEYEAAAMWAVKGATS
jgi:hypothetical protein